MGNEGWFVTGRQHLYSPETLQQAGGAHYTVYSQNLTSEHLEDFAAMAKLEMVLIDKNTNVRNLKNELRWNKTAYQLNK